MLALLSSLNQREAEKEVVGIRRKKRSQWYFHQDVFQRPFMREALISF